MLPRRACVHAGDAYRRASHACDAPSPSFLVTPLRLTSLGRVLRLPDGEERERHLSALIEALLKRHGPLEPGESLRIYASTYSTLPEQAGSPPLRRELVFAYHAGDDVEPRTQP